MDLGLIRRGRRREGEGMVAKGVIVLVAFPVLVHAIFTLTSLVLGPVLPSLLPLAGDWSDLAGKGVIVATFLVAVRVSFGVCRRMWPISV
jgi:hypothetical protein